MRLARDHDEPHGQLLQPAEAPARLRQAVEPRARLGGQAPVGRRGPRRRAASSAVTGELTAGAPPDGSGGFTVTGHPATISTTSLARPRHRLVDEAEDVAEPAAERRLRVHAPARPRWRRGSGRRRERATTAASSAASVRRSASESSGLFRSRFATQRLRQSTTTMSAAPCEPRSSADGSSSGTSTVRQAGGRSALMAGDARGHLGVARLGGGDEHDAPAERPGASDRERALAARGRRPGRGGSGGSRSARAGTPARRCRVRQPGPPLEDRFGVRGSQAGLLALGSSYSPRLPGAARQWARVRVSSPITVTGSRRFRTAFPLGPATGAHLGPRERR